MNQPLNQDPNQPQPVAPPPWPPAGGDVPIPNAAVPPDPLAPPVAPAASEPLITEGQSQSLTMETPGSGKKTMVLVIVLIILIILGGVILASFAGWINLGGIEKLWGGGSTSAPSTETTTPTTPTPTTTNQNDLQRKTDLANIKTALKKYYQAKQAYPEATAVQKTSDTDTALKVLVPDYLTQVPVDPLSPQNYYGYKSDGKTFELTAVLEDTTDPAGIKTGNIYLYKVTDSSAETLSASSSSSATTSTTSNPASDLTTEESIK